MAGPGANRCRVQKGGTSQGPASMLSQLAVGALVWLVWPVMEQSRGATDAERRDLAGSRLNAVATGGWTVGVAGLLLQLAMRASARRKRVLCR